MVFDDDDTRIGGSQLVSMAVVALPLSVCHCEDRIYTTFCWS